MDFCLGPPHISEGPWACLAAIARLQRLSCAEMNLDLSKDSVLCVKSGCYVSMNQTVLCVKSACCRTCPLCCNATRIHRDLTKCRV
eukprot:5153964-Amphidinium_carterae.1